MVLLHIFAGLLAISAGGIATGSFFLGQAKVLPESMRIVPLLAAPVVLVLLPMVYWWVRVSFTKRIPQRV